MSRYSEVIDGLVLPARWAGHPALDFCNTLAGWNDPVQKDYLQTYDHLAVWAHAAGLVDAEAADRARHRARRDGPRAEQVLRRAVAFRHALYEVCLRPGPGKAWDVVGAEARAARAAAILAPVDGHGRWELPDRVGLDLPLLGVAMAAGDLVTSADLASIGSCPGRQCGWLFLDRTHRRRWCSMAVCGNRAKVRRHLERSRGAGGTDRQANRGRMP